MLHYEPPRLGAGPGAGAAREASAVAGERLSPARQLSVTELQINRPSRGDWAAPTACGADRREPHHGAPLTRFGALRKLRSNPIHHAPTQVPNGPLAPRARAPRGRHG